MEYLNREIYEQILCFQQLVKSYRSAGIKMKKLANQLQLQPSVISALYTTVFPAILKQGPPPMDFYIAEEAFRKVNNVSIKFLAHLKTHIIGLKALDKSGTISQRSQPELWFEKLEKQYNRTFDKIGSQLDGSYYCFTISSNRNALKQDILRITSNESSRTIFIEKGNQHSYNSFTGYADLTREHQAVIHLYDQADSPAESEFINFTLPVIKSPEIIVGILSGMDYNRQPISRRLVLYRAENSNSYKSHILQYHQPTNLDSTSKAIFNFLRSQKSSVRLINLPSPMHNINNLIDHAKINDVIFNLDE